MTQIDIRIQGRAGRITLNRPQALNAVTAGMLRAIGDALTDWQDNSVVDLILIDAAGDRAFAAGGDIVDLYNTGRAGDFGFGQGFWADEYRLNARIAAYPKPFVAFMQGFVMGGGVGISCHGSHRIVDESVQIAMPECGIGLVPDVGGSQLLAQAPGRLGHYLGLTGSRMNTSDALYAGFADTFVPANDWPALKDKLCKTGDVGLFNTFAQHLGSGPLEALQDQIDALFEPNDVTSILSQLNAADTEFAQKARTAILRGSPLSVTACMVLLDRVAQQQSIRYALTQEYRFTARAMEHGDFLEGIRAQVIDKDRKPNWRHQGPQDVPPEETYAMLASLGDAELTFD